jgi:hypothetical protein
VVVVMVVVVVSVATASVTCMSSAVSLETFLFCNQDNTNV